MKKLTAVFLAIIFCFICSTCSKDGIGSGANVEVSVVNLFKEPVKGITVYLFVNELSSNPNGAKKQVVTNDKGVALFRLNFTDLNIVESETPLYFLIFYTLAGHDFMAGSDPSAITLSRGEVKKVEIKAPV